MTEKSTEVPKWVQKFLQNVFDMRQAQNEYFAGKTDHRLKVAKAKEAIVDEVLKRAAAAGAIETETPTITQQNLF